MLAREVLRLRGSIANREAEWDVMVDLYFYRDPEAEGTFPPFPNTHFEFLIIYHREQGGYRGEDRR